METIRAAVAEAFNYIRMIGISDILDILIIAFVIYEVAKFIRKTNSSGVAVGVIILILALWLSGELNLTVVNFLLRSAMSLGLLALVVLFQPELRRVLEKVGSGRFGSLWGWEVSVQSLDSAITQTVLACAAMAKTKTGVLIIFERDNKLYDQLNTGTIIDAETTAELLKNLFYPKAPLHDGAVIIREGRIAAAGCMLPLSSNTNLSKDLGMRHRAGIGVSERSDAVVVVVSEETGAISVAVDGMLKRHLSPETCERLLRNELLPDGDEKRNGAKKLVNLIKVKKDGKKNV